MNEWLSIEVRRLALQSMLDSGKTPTERNVLGQFSTPTPLARQILEMGIKLLPAQEPIRFFDPALGTGAFYSALRSVASLQRIERAWGYEIDPYYALPSQELWAGEALEVRCADFTCAMADQQANLLICNPPYVRHHHLERGVKMELQDRVAPVLETRISGLAGMYCYFMALAHAWMSPGAIAGWLIPSEFMEVNYGRAIRHYLSRKVTLLRIHRFKPEDVQFADALVSSAVVWLRNEPPATSHQTQFSYGGQLNAPQTIVKTSAQALHHEPKWTKLTRVEPRGRGGVATTLGEWFDIKRGIATGANDFFVMTHSQIEERGLPMEVFTPVLPSSRYVPEDEIRADSDGLPLLPRQYFLLNTRLPISEIEARYPALASYLARGTAGENAISQRYLCRSRNPWYVQESRPPAPLLCTYMGRVTNGGKPFRFILNHSQATAANVYLLLYPKPALQALLRSDPTLLRHIWESLRAISLEELTGQGRVYGGGLYKLEPKELRALPIKWGDLSGDRAPAFLLQAGLFS